MANSAQPVETPLGITVFGSFVLRMEPDIASLSFAVSRMMAQPRDAFRETREAAQKITAFLAQTKITDFSASLITLSRTFEHHAGERNFVGYTAKATFHLVLHDLKTIEDVLAGLVDSGVDELEEIEFQTSRLKAIRAEARRQAVDAAREKAENYCKAAGVILGAVIRIEDVNPDVLRRRVFHGPREMQPTEEEVPEHAVNPGSITVGAAVVITYKIE